MCGAVHYEYSGNTKYLLRSLRKEFTKFISPGEPQATALCHCMDWFVINLLPISITFPLAAIQSNVNLFQTARNGQVSSAISFCL